MQDLEKLIRGINFDAIENKDYWIWYITWYMAENMVVWYPFALAWKAIYVQSIAKFRKIIDKFKIANKIWKLDNKKIDINLLNKSLTDSEIIKFQRVISANFPWYNETKKARFLKRMLEMDDWMQKEYFDNFEWILA